MTQVEQKKEKHISGKWTGKKEEKEKIFCSSWWKNKRNVRNNIIKGGRVKNDIIKEKKETLQMLHEEKLTIWRQSDGDHFINVIRYTTQFLRSIFHHHLVFFSSLHFSQWEAVKRKIILVYTHFIVRLLIIIYFCHPTFLLLLVFVSCLCIHFHQ